MAFNPDDPRLPRLYRVNVHNDMRRVVETGEGGVYGWMADQQGRARIGRGFNDSRMRERIFFKDPDGTKWEPFIDRDVDDGPEFNPVMFDREDPDLLYVLSNHESDTTGLYRFRFSSREFIERLFLHPEVDVHRVIRDPSGREIHGVSYVTEESHSEWFDRRQAEYVEDVRLRVAARHVRIVSSSWDYWRMVMYAESPDVPGRYYLYEPATKKLDYFAHTYPDLEKTPLSRTRAVTYEARDGLPIPAYLTLPPGTRRNPEKPLPAVIFPHGGPHARDFAAFDPLVQLMTSRGYAVLQMNFRGSWGYGREFMQAGKHQWGQAMQDDVTDGTRWLIEEGIADPERICIAGWSYGGYAALMGAVKEPSLYRCAVSIAGVSNLPRLIDGRREYMFGRVATRYIGDSWKDRKSLNENSPVNRAAEIRVPILLAHGTKDRVVPVTQSTSMGRALRRAGKVYEYVELEDTDHSVMHGTERLKLFRALDDFLAQQLGGDET